MPDSDTTFGVVAVYVERLQAGGYGVVVEHVGGLVEWWEVGRTGLPDGWPSFQHLTGRAVEGCPH